MGEDKTVVVYQCPQCNNYSFKTREAGKKHHQRYNHCVIGVNAGGEVVEEVGKGRRGPKPGLPGFAATPKKLVISAQGDEHIKEHFKGYAKEKESFLFVMHPDGTIKDYRLEQPILYPIFELMKKERGYVGDFPQFMADAVETLFANAGYELTLAPKSQGEIYQEVVRLVNEGKLELVDQDGKIVLGVKNRDKKRDSPRGKEVGAELAQEGKREKETGQAHG